jgi:acetylornithine deacetylase/succinyl-diaminopimelate desuccinylase-like protein
VVSLIARERFGRSEMSDNEPMTNRTASTETVDESFDVGAAQRFIRARWRDDLTPQLVDYVRIPALSPTFDADWATSGHIDAAVDQISTWLASRPVAGLRRVEVKTLPGRTPIILVEIDPFGPEQRTDTTVLLYGHLDKQPEMIGWRDDLGPWTPVIENGRLYGRGAADDGYAAFASLTAIEAVQQSGGSHARCIILIEASEESGSPDLPAHVEVLADELGDVDLVLCLDSGCNDYERLWLTTSLRGLAGGKLGVAVVEQGIHSGAASGVVPSSFRIARHLLDRIEDSETGEILIQSANVEIPPHRVAEAEALVAELGDAAIEPFATVAGLGLMTDGPAEALLARTWRPALSVTGADGLPATDSAGNVIRPETVLRLSLRIPPTADPDAVLAELTDTLTVDPPYNAVVRFDAAKAAPGWDAPDLAPWLADALEAASQRAFGRSMQRLGEGGTIPFMGMLGEQFPDAQFVITGVLGPESNAHGPNEFLHLDYAEKLTNCMAHVLHSHASRRA